MAGNGSETAAEAIFLIGNLRAKEEGRDCMDDRSKEFRTSRGYQLIDRKEGRMTPAEEDYLEMIFRLCSGEGYTRVGKLAGLLNVKPSSASKMIWKLADMGYLKYDRYEIILLTESGKTAGQFLLNRHNTVNDFLNFIGSGGNLEETEQVEHPIGPSTVKNLQTLLNYFQENPKIARSYQEFREKERAAHRHDKPENVAR